MKAIFRGEEHNFAFDRVMRADWGINAKRDESNNLVEDGKRLIVVLTPDVDVVATGSDGLWTKEYLHKRYHVELLKEEGERFLDEWEAYKQATMRVPEKHTVNLEPPKEPEPIYIPYQPYVPLTGDYPIYPQVWYAFRPDVDCGSITTSGNTNVTQEDLANATPTDVAKILTDIKNLQEEYPYYDGIISWALMGDSHEELKAHLRKRFGRSVKKKDVVEILESGQHSGVCKFAKLCNRQSKIGKNTTPTGDEG